MKYLCKIKTPSCIKFRKENSMDRHMSKLDRRMSILDRYMSMLDGHVSNLFLFTFVKTADTMN